MKVFISWSGQVSHSVAIAVRDWLPNVIQAIEPYLSSEDIDKGARWSSDIAKELADSSFGILCVTPENIDAPWVNFEAGALSKSLEQSRVAPLLFEVQRTDVTGPLLQFQSTITEKEDMRKLVRSLNQACNGGALEEGRLDEVFDVWWPRLEAKLEEISAKKPAPAKPPTRPTQDLLAEVLDLVRGQQKLLSDPMTILPVDYLRFALQETGVAVRERDEISPAAVEDARQGWMQLMRVIQEHDVPPEVGEAVHRLEGPLEYILHRLVGTRRRRPLRSRPPTFDAPGE